MSCNQNSLSQRDIISPEVQVMVDVTKANTEQLMQVNTYLMDISADIKSVRTYFDSKDGFQQEINIMFEKHMNWMWLKFAGATSALVAIIFGVAALLGT